MAYSAKDLSVIGYANGFTLWHYATPDAAAAVDSSGYFNSASDMLRVGDFIFANVETAGTQKAGMFWISSNSGGVVDVNDITAIGAADTD